MERYCLWKIPYNQVGGGVADGVTRAAIVSPGTADYTNAVLGICTYTQSLAITTEMTTRPGVFGSLTSDHRRNNHFITNVIICEEEKNW